jgi:hypothetical protein
MSEWIVKNKRRNYGADIAEGVLTFGVSVWLGKLLDLDTSTYYYDLENEDTGEEKTVLARDRFDLGDKISEGEFEED